MSDTVDLYEYFLPRHHLHIAVLDDHIARHRTVGVFDWKCSTFQTSSCPSLALAHESFRIFETGGNPADYKDMPPHQCPSVTFDSHPLRVKRFDFGPLRGLDRHAPLHMYVA